MNLINFFDIFFDCIIRLYSLICLEIFLKINSQQNNPINPTNLHQLVTKNITLGI